MERGVTGQYRHKVGARGMAYRPFVPAPLPPVPPVELSGGLLAAHNQALHALGLLAGLGLMLPSPELFVELLVRKEAALSSQIEGSRCTVSNVLAWEDVGREVTLPGDVEQVSRYGRALASALAAMGSGRDITLELLVQSHAAFMAPPGGEGREPGFRQSQNWVNGPHPGNCEYVPPPPEELARCLAELAAYANKPEPGGSELVKAGLAHLQFESIHPFLDGNGRMGRLLIVLVLARESLLARPLLYPSIYLKERRREYFDLLNLVRRTGDWERWLEFFFAAITATARRAAAAIQGLRGLLDQDQERLAGLGRLAPSAGKVFALLARAPWQTAQSAAAATGLSAPTVHKAIDALAGLGVLEEVTGKQRDRIYRYAAYLDLLEK